MLRLASNLDPPDQLGLYDYGYETTTWLSSCLRCHKMGFPCFINRKASPGQLVHGKNCTVVAVTG
jgi:hypothetical protein